MIKLQLAFFNHYATMVPRCKLFILAFLSNDLEGL